MSDPAVTAYLTRLLCSHGGRLERNHLANQLDLPAEQIEQILQEEPLRFPQTSQLVLARSPLRICTNYLHPKGEEEEEKCPKLHLCRDYLRGQCLPNRRLRCRFSHDVLSDHNRVVLKANELSGLNEEEIKVLLFQNDNQLLPAACRKYMYDNCDKEEDCTRLHVCSYFIQGECSNRSCKRLHNLLESNLLLICSWLNQETIQNFQMLCVLTHNERQQARREGPRNEEPRGARGMSQNIGRGRPRNRRTGPQESSRERRNKGSHVHQQSDSSLRSRSSLGQRSGDKNYNRAGEWDHSDISRTRLESLMDDWFSPNTSPLGNAQDRSSRTSAGVTSQEGTRSVPSTKDLVVSSKVDKPDLLSTLALPVEFSNSRIAHAIPSAPFNLPKMGYGPPNTAIAAPIISQPYTHALYTTVSQTKPTVSPPVTSSTSKQMPIKKLDEKLCSPVAEPANVKPVPSLRTTISLCSTSESSSIARPQPATSAVPCHLDRPTNLLGISHFCGVSIEANTPSRKNQTDLKPIIKPAAASYNQQHLSDLIDPQPKTTNSMASEPQPTTNLSSVTPQKWMKQNNILYQTESEMSQKLEFLDYDRVQMLRGSIKSHTNHSKQNPVDSPWKMVNYPPTWDLKAVPEMGYQNIPVPETCDEFATISKMFSKTVQGYMVQKVWRVQNPTLWQAYQRQKDQMKNTNVGINVNETQLFHGTDRINITTICKDNFDCLCGTMYGQGNYFARDALYAHNYSPATATRTRTMFVARVLVGNFTKGDLAMRSPLQKSWSTERYDSCVNSIFSPSIFAVFEKSQVYPEYILEYKKEKSACMIS